MRRSIHFSKFSTAGNTTLFVEEQAMLMPAWQEIKAEQAGYANIEEGKLEMSGGEFCLNASLAFVALADFKSRLRIKEVITSGQSLRAGLKGNSPAWVAWLELNLKHISINPQGGACLVDLPGISHVLMETETIPDNDYAFAKAERVKKEYELEEAPAFGIIWWQKTRQGFIIKPVVTVPKANTCNSEAACGSGSLALALRLGEGAYKMKQPSGEIIEVTITGDKARVESPVRLLAAGGLQVF